MDLELFKEILSVDSTSGRERALSELLASRLEAPALERFEVGDGTENLLFSWGEPSVVFCTHMDTVPPYIPPVFLEDRVCGRGACDAKGQILALYTACKRLEASGADGFGLLLLSGEETGSFGAKAFARTPFRAPFLIVGEPTENRMVSSSKGTKAFSLRLAGEAFHSGYPQFGVSAVELFVDFVGALREFAAGYEGLTYNIGLLHSDNPQNILSPELSCRVYFRTTAASDAAVCDWMMQPRERVEVEAFGGDAPAEYVTLEGFESAPAAFGSDAPHLSNFGHKIICGPGSIAFAHRPDEHVLLADLSRAADLYVAMFRALTGGDSRSSRE
ncbi:MAG: M20/M25/M40 family metallo-hydrolase [Bacteroidales bacterium]|nr:M20/M25/M40 family metallo-hydrolase [Bacteroidales bacterium]